MLVVGRFRSFLARCRSFRSFLARCRSFQVVPHFSKYRTVNFANLSMAERMDLNGGNPFLWGLTGHSLLYVSSLIGFLF